jgi:hypothetical protein
MMVMRHIAPFVPGCVAGNDNPPYAAFRHQVTDRPVHRGNPKTRASALRVAQEVLWGERAVHVTDGSENGHSLLSLSLRR